MLDLDKAGTPDPYVERLFEGVAFSMERLREKIDDDLPELTEGLVSMLWPHYLRTIPWLSVVALTPELPTMKMAETVPAGLQIYSRPLGPKKYRLLRRLRRAWGRVRYRLSTRIGWTTRRGAMTLPTPASWRSWVRRRCWILR